MASVIDSAARFVPRRLKNFVKYPRHDRVAPNCPPIRYGCVEISPARFRWVLVCGPVTYTCESMCSRPYEMLSCLDEEAAVELLRYSSAAFLQDRHSGRLWRWVRLMEERDLIADGDGWRLY